MKYPRTRIFLNGLGIILISLDLIFNTPLTILFAFFGIMFLLSGLFPDTMGTVPFLDPSSNKKETDQ